MSDAPRDAGADKLRQRIAEEAARMVANGGDAARSRFRAARRVTRGWVPEDQLPSHDDIRREVTRGSDPAGGLAHLAGDRFDRMAEFVRMLEHVKQDPVKHPEGDVLEHTLQVFDRVYEERPFDEELLTAALVHDVGRAIDRADPVTACVSALADLMTPRTRWFVESLADAAAHGNHTLGARARQRLESHPDFLEALLLAECDRKACIRGYDAVSLDEAIAILRALAADDEADERGA
jgi:predicted HD phosphohydrolase